MSELALPNPAEAALPRGERLLSDELLSRLVGRGSARAFAVIYERHHQALYRYCRSIVRDEHDAQDALQATMVRAYAALRGQERDLAVRAWLFRIAHNESISLLRKRGRDLDLNSDRDLLGADLEGTVETRARLAALVADLGELPERQRAALVMRELSGLRIEEIAGALSTSPAAAKQALFEARNSLREIAEGREMLCESVREAVSARDGRLLRSRKIRAHLRACEDCRAFRTAIGARESDLRALAPALPGTVAGAILHGLLGRGGHLGGGAGGAAASGSSLLGHAGGSLIAKGVAGAVIVAAAATGTAHLAVVGSDHRAGGVPDLHGSVDHRAGANQATLSPTGDRTQAGAARAQRERGGTPSAAGADSAVTSATGSGNAATAYNRGGGPADTHEPASSRGRGRAQGPAVGGNSGLRGDRQAGAHRREHRQSEAHAPATGRHAHGHPAPTPSPAAPGAGAGNQSAGHTPASPGEAGVQPAPTDGARGGSTQPEGSHGPIAGAQRREAAATD